MKQEPIFPVKIEALVSQIESKMSMTSELLVMMLQSLDIQAEELQQFADPYHPQHFSYGRRKIYTGNNFAVYLMTWASGDFTAIHNHGYTDWGAVCFLGEITHRHYSLEGNEIKLVSPAIIQPGTVAPVNGSLIHAMGNLNQGYSLSLHVYGSNRPGLIVPNNTSHIYELEKKRTRITSGEAYIDGSDYGGIYSDNIRTNEETLIDYLKILLPYYEKNNHTEMVAYIRSVLTDPAHYFMG